MATSKVFGRAFKAFKRGDCPICHGAKSGCKSLSDDLVLCRDFSANPGSNWRYVKETKDGIWGMWAWGEGEDRRDSRPAYTPKEPSAPSVPSWDAPERDKGYRAIAGKLAFGHRLAIAKRPHVSDREIDALVNAGVLMTWPGGQAVPGAHVGLPGVRPDGRLAAWHTWAVAARDLQGRIVGIQYRNDRKPDEGKYKWASGWGGASVNRADGELPITVLGTPQDGVMNLAEGIGLKPGLGWQRYGGLWLGASGGNFASSPNQLRAVVDTHGITQAILNADGEAIANHNVMRPYRALATLLEGWGIPLLVRWWGQATKADGDVDEIAPEVFYGAKLLTWAEFEKLSPHRELTDLERARQRRAQRIEADRRAWLASVAALAGVPEDSERDAIAGAFHTQHTLSGPSEVGTFPALALPTERRLTVLDGQKMTRKTSKALATAVHDAERSGLRGVVYAPTRVLARSLAKVLGIHTVDQFNALPQDKRPPIPWIAACPESAWKLADLNPDVMVFDEGNESSPRLQSGILGNHPQQSREVVKQQLLGCRWCIVAQDGVYRPTVATLQRWGQFALDEVETIRRGRVATEMAIVLYQGMGGQTESWDGTALKKAPQTDFAFYTWFDGIVQALKAGQKVIIPCGSEGRLRAIHRVLRSIFPDNRGQVIDGKYTPQGVRSAFADNPSGFAESRGLDWLGYSPTFDSGVSIEGTYFDAQFEYVRAFEPASNASQRGERYRDAIRGEKLIERHIYIAQRGLPSMPPVEVFTPGYWRDLLTHPTDTEIINLARQIGGDDLVQRLDQDAHEDWLELPQFMAIQARETYFKVELLTQEWQRNGWEILPGVEDAEAAARWSDVFYDVNQGIVEQKSRALAKAKGKKSEGDEVAGAIEATKARKWELTQTLGPDFALLSSPEFMESWVVAGDGSLQALQVGALVTMAHTQPDLWQQIRQAFALTAVARADGMDTPDLPCSPRAYELAKLLASAPGLWEMMSGATPEWMHKAPAVLALANWTLQHAKALGRLTATAQRIHGLQFTPKTPAIQCINKLLKMVGLETQSRRGGSGGREWWYRLVSVDDIAAKLAKAKRPHDLRRRLYRVDTQTEVMAALAAVIEAKALAPEWAALKADLLARYQASTTSVRENLTTEVLDGTQFLDCRGWAELRKMLTEAIQIGAAAVADLREIVLATFGPNIWEQLSF